MDARFSEIWLLISVLFVVQLPVTPGRLCQQDWTFHALTGSCMAVIRTHFTYSVAKYYCQDNVRSITTKRDGHLVFIFNKATDDFVKGLLNEQGVNRAFIGLNDRARNGDYMWGFKNAIPVSYTGWADNPHTPDDTKNTVIMTKDGWQEYDSSSTIYFVCQVSVDFPTPRIVCPLAEVGHQSSGIRCTTDTHQPFTITGVRFMKTAAVVASCDANRCWPGLGYEQVVDVTEPPERDSSASLDLKLRNVRISDASGWTCSVEFNNSGYWVASQPCSLNVYRKPADIKCSHQFVQATVTITCTAAQVYPQVGCSWNVNRGSQKVYNQTVYNDVVPGAVYYRATCNASFNITNTGRYDVTVIMTPRLPIFGIEAVKETSVSVLSPQPPQLYHAGQIIQSSWVEVVENQTLTLTCLVPGGDPQVYRTIITCDNIPQPFESDGSSVTMDVRVTREFHGRNCTCSALHAARYRQTLSVAIRVIYPVIPVSENDGSPAQFVEAIVVGIVAAVLVVIICVIIFLFKREGAPCKRKNHQYANTSMHAVNETHEPGSRHGLEEVPEAHAPEYPHYEEPVDFRSGIPNHPVHPPHQAPEYPHYDDTIDFGSDIPNYPVHDPHQAPEYPHYDDTIDFERDMPDNQVHYPNQILLNARDADVEYANTVNSL